jgi:hypothetical protein
MHPYISQAVAAERIRDLQNEATAARLARLARQARRGRVSARAARAVAGRRQSQPVTDPQLTCVEFLARTAGALVREPSAAERAHGQPVG